MPLKTLVFKLLKQSYLNKDKLSRLKREWAKEHGSMPKNSQILAAYKNLLKTGKIKPEKALEKFLRLKKIRSLSGIVPIAVLTKPYSCPGKCIYCPTEAKMPKSYLADEPAVMRAVKVNFDPFKQVSLRLKQLEKIGHATDKIELIVMGGTFNSLPRCYQVDFISQCFAAANKAKNYLPSEDQSVCDKSSEDRSKTDNFKLKNLQKIQKENEKAKNRIVGLTLETRPDMINEKEVRWFRRLGCTRVEIGVQSIYDNILEIVKRGHRVTETIKATKLLKDAGFKVCYHLMPNLPGATPQKDLKMFKIIFSDSKFMPDMIKIYPCVVTYKSQLYDWYKKGKFKPYTDSGLVELLLKIKQLVPEWVRINRLVRDIPAGNIVAGSKISNMRQILHQKMTKDQLKCSCIRCREIRGDELRVGNLKLEVCKYVASDGDEYFFQYVDKNRRLYAMLRLRIPSQIAENKKHFIPTLQNATIIRELHTYGEVASIKQKGQKVVQHRRLGKKLIQQAENKTKNLGIKKIAVISGVGVREYFQKLNYILEDDCGYMIKKIK